MANVRFKTTIELDVEVVGHYTGPTPSKLSGPPEDCYEGESAHFEVEAVLVTVGERATVNVLEALSEADLDALREQGCEEARESIDDAMADAAEARRDFEEDR